jgi:hypothetical protein
MIKQLSMNCDGEARLIRVFFIGLLLVLTTAIRVSAQTDEPPKREVAAEFVTLTREDVFEIRGELGFGGRFTYNLNKNFAIEAATYFFPRNCFNCLNNGSITEAVGGLKAGKRFKSWGIFAKARPGIVSFSKGQFDILPTGTSPAFPFIFQVRRLTEFAADLGGVLEFYPSRRIVTRFDVGDTIIHFRRRTHNDIRFDPMTDTFTLVPVTRPGRTTHNLQFSASVGFRW